jgi:hypothetical protein
MIMDQQTLRGLLEQLTSEAKIVEERRHAVEVVLGVLEKPALRSNGSSTYQPDLSTNIGRVVEFIRAAPNGLTLFEIIQKSAENGARPMMSSSIGSQLRFQVKRGVVKKQGDRYHAVAR